MPSCFHVEAVLKVLHRLAGREWHRPTAVELAVSFEEGKALLDTHTEALLGLPPAGRDVHIMETMPSESGSNWDFLSALPGGRAHAGRQSVQAQSQRWSARTAVFDYCLTAG